MSADTTGHEQMSEWFQSYGDLVRVVVEGTGSYGAGLTHHLAGVDTRVVEVNRPYRQMRRRWGKTDTVDGHAAARAALNGEAQDPQIRGLCARANPALLATLGVGAHTAAALLIATVDNPQRMRSEASFAALCGVSPVQASSGQTVRYRLNRGGNRQANNSQLEGGLDHNHEPPRVSTFGDQLCALSMIVITNTG